LSRKLQIHPKDKFEGQDYLGIYVWLSDVGRKIDNVAATFQLGLLGVKDSINGGQ